MNSPIVVPVNKLPYSRVTVINKTKGNAVIAARVCVARGFFEKLHGLMFRKEMGKDEGLLLEKASSIHMCFMKFPIDVVFLDGSNKVVKTVNVLKPWTLWCGERGAVSVLELPAGLIQSCNVQEGDEIIFKLLS